MVALAFHLWHGVWSLFQTLGLINPKSDKMIHRLAAIATLAVVIGFISIPLAVWRASSPKLGGLTMELRANVPAGPIDQKWDTTSLRDEAGQPCQ